MTETNTSLCIGSYLVVSETEVVSTTRLRDINGVWEL